MGLSAAYIGLVLLLGLPLLTLASPVPRRIQLLRGLKLLRVYRLQKFIMDMEHNYNVHHGVSRMFNIIIVVLLATHLVGCVWYFLGIQGGESMLVVKNELEV